MVQKQRKANEVTKFQETLIGFLSDVNKTIKNGPKTLDEKLQKLIGFNQELLQVISQAISLGATPLEKQTAEKLANALGSLLSRDYRKNEKLLERVLEEVKKAERELGVDKPQQRPKF